ncbi:hypothetical protein C8J56DRAFT_296480 [Mycena floridula]|nr:hypothetical protein C8J56DRAFT_296480 [Mycena floridula]
MLFGQQAAAPIEPKVQARPEVQSPEDLLRMLFGRREEQKAHPEVQAPEDLLRMLFGRREEQPKVQAHPEAQAPDDLLRMLFGRREERPKVEPKVQAAAHPEAQSLENLFHMFLGQQASAPVEPKAEPAPAVQIPKPVQSVPVPSAAPESQSAPKSPVSSLKDQLESRLYSDESTEIRDTIQAIFASLSDSQQAAPANGLDALQTLFGSFAGHQVPQSTSGPSASSSSSSASSSKGKSKAEPVAPQDATSRDVVHAFDVMSSIQTAFSTLESEFVFPPQLDFVNVKPSADGSASDSDSSSTSKLAFTARNQPVKYYEQSLTGLLVQLDQIDSFGNEELRTVRKEIVGKVEKAIEDLENEIEGRWRTKVIKEQKSAPVEVAAPVQPVVPTETKVQPEAVDAGSSEPSVEPESPVVAAAPVVEEPQPEKVAPEASTASSYPPTVASSVAAIRPYIVDESETDSVVDAPISPKKRAEEDAGSDWSEVDA